MDSYLIGYLVTIAASPILLAGILWVARKDMRRTITALSALALGLGLAIAIIFTLALKTAAESQSTYPFVPISTNGSVYITLLPILEQGHAFALEVAIKLQTAAWVLSLYHAVQTRRGRWLTVIVACAAFSLFMSFFASNVNLVGIIATSPQLNGLIATHPYGMLFVLNALTTLAAAAALLYAQVGMREVRAGRLIPGAVVDPIGGALPSLLLVSATGADEAEDVEFVVERLPSGRGERR